MSLLMQALKKAERNRQDSPPDEDLLEPPSEAFDELLALTPQDVIQGRVPPSQAEFTLEPLDGERPADAPDRRAARDDQDGEQIPALLPAEEALHNPTPPQSRREPARSVEAPAELSLQELTPVHPDAAVTPAEPSASLAPLRTSRPMTPDLARAAGSPAAGPSLGNAPSPALDGGVPAATGSTAGAGSSAASGPRSGAAAGPGAGATAASTATTATTAGAAAGVPKGPSGAAARARAAAAARAAAEQDKVGWDPARVRLAALSAALAVILALFGYVYWRATSSPGPGAALPMVPMPPPNATGATPALVVVPPGGVPEAAAGSGAPPGLPSAGAAPGYPPEPLPDSAPTAPPPPPSVPSDVAGAIRGARTPADADLQRALQQAAAEQAAMAASAAGQPPQSASQSTPMAGAPPAAPAQQAPGWRTQAASPSQPGSDIKVTRSSAPPRISPSLQSGYQAYTAGDLPAAAQHYEAALRQDPNNRDALLGHAAVAVRQNATAQAAAAYLRLLELNPSDPDALAGLLSLRPGDTGQSETRMKDVLRRAPDSGPLLFALGNLYARQARWTDAQQAYFRAYSANPDHADYAFNLAVGLDRLNQRKLALTYYERALALAQAGPAAFDREAVRLRTRQLMAAAAAPAAPAAPAAALPATPLEPATEAAADGYRP